MIQRNFFFAVPLDKIDLADAVELGRRAMRERRRLQIGDVNVAKLVDMQSNTDLRKCLEQSDLICADGMGVVLGCRLLGVPVGQRVAGIDLMSALIEVCAQEGFRPYFLGAKQTVVEDMVARLSKQHPSLEIAGWRNGYFTSDDEDQIVAEIRASGADCVFVGISSPIKERFLNRHRDDLGVPLQMGVGGSFDVLSGHIPRAPVAVQRMGLEWLFRLLQEPRRLARRYYVSNTRYLVLLARNLLSHHRLPPKLVDPLAARLPPPPDRRPLGDLQAPTQ
ncbi:MAG: WecB/TagA/CpsF family glycosyltransferase [Hyphomicrobiaceae bacterium]